MRSKMNKQNSITPDVKTYIFLEQFQKNYKIIKIYLNFLKMGVINFFNQ